MRILNPSSLDSIVLPFCLISSFISFSFNDLKIRFSYFPVFGLQGRIHYFLRHERTKQAA